MAPRRTLWQCPPSGARWRRSLLLALPALGACLPALVKTTTPFSTVGTDSGYTAPGTDTTGTTDTGTTDTGTTDTGTTDSGTTDTGPDGTGDTGYTYTGTAPGTTSSRTGALGPLPRPTGPR